MKPKKCVWSHPSTISFQDPYRSTHFPSVVTFPGPETQDWTRSTVWVTGLGLPSHFSQSLGLPHGLKILPLTHFRSRESCSASIMEWARNTPWALYEISSTVHFLKVCGRMWGPVWPQENDYTNKQIKGAPWFQSGALFVIVFSSKVLKHEIFSLTPKNVAPRALRLSFILTSILPVFPVNGHFIPLVPMLHYFVLVYCWCIWMLLMICFASQTFHSPLKTWMHCSWSSGLVPPKRPPW